MPGDTFGELFRVTTWGESHGPAIGVVIEGCPPSIKLNREDIQKDLDRRRPGQSHLTTPRKESDKALILSGVFEGKTTGAPISIMAINSDVRSGDYAAFKDLDRPGHAGFAYRAKYGIVDYRGGGRASYRETWGRVAAGAIAKKFLREKFKIEIVGYVLQVGGVHSHVDFKKVTAKQVDAHITRCPDASASKRMETLIERAKMEGDSLGGVVGLVVRNVPKGLGEPVFDKIDADLFKALKSIHATKAVEIGMGFEVAGMKGSEHNDLFGNAHGKVQPMTNKAGGVLGGITTGEDLILRVAFKPTATIQKVQSTVNVKGKKVLLKGEGRHDPCVLPRAVPAVEAMVALTLMDHALRFRAQCGLDQP